MIFLLLYSNILGQTDVKTKIRENNRQRRETGKEKKNVFILHLMNFHAATILRENGVKAKVKNLTAP